MVPLCPYIEAVHAWGPRVKCGFKKLSSYLRWFRGHSPLCPLAGAGFSTAPDTDSVAGCPRFWKLRWDEVKMSLFLARRGCQDRFRNLVTPVRKRAIKTCILVFATWLQIFPIFCSYVALSYQELPTLWVNWTYLLFYVPYFGVKFDGD